jgi:arginine repressor
MAKTKIRGEGSKAIRDYFSKNPIATAQEVVDGLKAEGVTVTASLVYNVKASGKKKKAAKKAAKKKAATKAAASTNGAASSTKADQIREVAGGMAKPVRPRDVIAILKDKGVIASSAQVSTVLLAMGMKKRKRRRRKAAVAGSAAVAGTSLNIDDLVAAKKLVIQVGSVEKVREALAALARLS